MGALLALLLGVAAGFFVLAMPIRMLETITTFTRLSKLMVYAEPPLSPNDRNVLAVLAGILTAGIGWVLVDWLLFGRAGMRTLIREREDDYEDEDGDSFRPTDPLDLVSPVPLPSGDWAPPSTSDARRPLSARTDIGDPPRPGVPPSPIPGIDQLLPPIDQILSGAPPLSGGVWGTPEAPRRDQTTEPDRQSPTAASGPGWLPTPGVRPDGSQPKFEVPAPPPLESEQPDAIVPAPSAFPPPPLIVEPMSFSQTPPPLQVAPPEPAPLPFLPPEAPPNLVFAPPPQSVAPPEMPVAPLPPPPAPLMSAAPPASVQQPVAAPAPRPPQEPGFDKARLEDLLARLERGLEKRRAAAARAAAAASAAPTPAVLAPVVPHAIAPEPPRAVPPAGYAARPPDPFAFPQPMIPPAGFAAPQPVIPQPVMPTTAAVHDLPPMPSASAYNLAPISPAGEPSSAEAALPPADRQGDALLDQPLHVTLDMLRSHVKR